MLKVFGLTCEGVINPLGVASATPSFGWIIQSGQKDIMQKTVQIQVSMDADFSKIVWDTGVVQSDESAYFDYTGVPLEEATRYFWRVKISDTHGNQSKWSEAAWFETPIKNFDAKWIAPEDSNEDSSVKLLRKSFEVTGTVISARLYATALGMYEMHIGKARVGEMLFAPGWTSYHHRLQYQTYDITALLHEGENTLTTSIANGWYKGEIGFRTQRNTYGDKRAFIGILQICYDDGRKENIATDDTWEWAQSPIVYSEWYHGETYDARLENLEVWKQVTVLDMPLNNLVPQDGAPVQKQECLKALEFIVTPKGEKVLDFGQNIAGWVSFKVKGQSGDKVVLSHAEVLDAQGNFYNENMRDAKVRIEYICKGGAEESYEPHFATQGFRFVRVDEYPGEINLDDFTAVVIHSEMTPIGSFACSNELINQLQHNITWGLKGNFIDIPTDCPQRDERLGWTGDAQIFARTATYLYDTRQFFRKWLRDLAADQTPEGGVPFVVPDILQNIAENEDEALIESNHSSCAWGDVAVILPWTMYLSYGDKRILAEQYASMKGWVEYIRSQANNGLWNTGFHFGDWVALDAKEGSYFGATPNDLTATAYYAYSTRILCQTAQVLGKASDAKNYKKLYESIVKAYQDEFFTPTGRLAARTQTAHIVSLVFGLTPEKFKQRTIDTLLTLLEENEGHLVTGFVGTPYFTHALAQNGQLKAAYDLLLREDYPSWLYQIKMGATTIWEHWDGIKPDGSMWSSNMNSFNHYAYGAIGDWLYRIVAGLEIDAEKPGYKNALIAPMPGGGLTYAEAELNTVYGKLKSGWHINDDEMQLSVEIPHNTTTTISMPNGDVYNVGSGVYSFSCKI